MYFQRQHCANDRYLRVELQEKKGGKNADGTTTPTSGSGTGGTTPGGGTGAGGVE